MADESLIVRIGADIRDFSRKMSGIADDLGGMEKNAGAGQITLGKLAGALGLVTLAGKGISMIGDSIGRAFGRIDTMEQFSRVMTTMLGDVDKADAVLQQVNDTVTGTAYGLDIAARSTQNFVTSGMEVDKATKAIATWGDAVAFYGDGSNETFATVTDALAKMQGRGKVSLEEINRMTEAGVPVMQLYADATGQSMGEVSKAISNGEISAEQFMDTMDDAMVNGTENFGSIEGAAKEAGASWGASFDNMRAAVARGITSIIENIDEMLTSNGLPDMRTMVSEFGSFFENTLKRIADFIPPLIGQLIEVYNTLKPWIPLIQTVAVAIGSWIAIVGTINSVTKAFLGVKGAIGALKGTMAFNPWVLGIAAVIALAFLIYKYWDEIVAVTKAVWNGIKEFFGTLWETIKTVFFGALESIQNFLSTAWETIKTVALELWSSIVEGILNILSPFIENAMNLWNNMKDGIFQIIEGLKQYFTGAWEIIKNIFLGAVLLLLNLVTGNFEELKTNAMQIWENIKNGFSQIWQGISNIFSGALKAVWGYIQGTWQNIVNRTKSSFTNAKNTVSNIWNSIKSFFSTVLSNIWNTVVGKFNDIVSSVRQKMRDVYNRVKNGWNDAKSFLTGINLKQIGKDIIQGLINGIKDKVAGVVNAVKDVTSAITGKIKGILGISSPSRVLKSLGEDTGQGLVNGLKSMLGKVSSMAEELAERAIVQPDSDIDIGYNTPSHVGVSGQGALSRGTDQYDRFGGGDSHVHYWQIDADEISDVQQLIGVIDGVVQSVRSR